MKNGTPLFSLRYMKILTNMQKTIFEILVQTALTVGLFWTILKLTPKSALLNFTILYKMSIRWISNKNLNVAQSMDFFLRKWTVHMLSYIKSPSIPSWKYLLVHSFICRIVWFFWQNKSKLPVNKKDSCY